MNAASFADLVAAPPQTCAITTPRSPTSTLPRLLPSRQWASQESDGEGSEGGGGAAEEAEEGRKGGMDRHEDARSAASGSTTEQDRRKVTQKFVQSWEHRIFGQESEELGKLVLRVRAATLLLVVTATAAFVLSDFVLFKGMTEAKMHRITSIGDLYTTAVA
eukprot:228680-Rhodomonas_salina.1